MTPWAWWSGEIGAETYDLALEEPTRDAAIAEAERQLSPGDTFQVVEARSSTAAECERTGFVPFLRTRNHEVLTVPGAQQEVPA